MSKNIFKNIFLLVHPFALNLWSFSSLRPFGGGSNLVVRPPFLKRGLGCWCKEDISPVPEEAHLCWKLKAEVNTGSDGTLIEITKLPGRLIVVLIPSKILRGWGPEVECCYIKRTQSWHNLVTWAQIIQANSTNIHRTALHSTHAAPWCALLLPSAIQLLNWSW